MAVLKGYIKAGFITGDEIKTLVSNVRKEYDLESLEIDSTGIQGLSTQASGAIWREVVQTLRKFGDENYVEFRVNAFKDGSGFAVVIIDPSSICTTKKLQKAFKNDIYGFPINEIKGVDATGDSYAIITVVLHSDCM